MKVGARMTIKEVAEKFDLTTDTLRYYERIGLIPEVPRTASGIRDFDEVTIKWVEFVLCFKKAGVPLEGIVEYVKLALQGAGTEPARREILVETRENLREKLEEIKECLALLDYKIDTVYKDCNVATAQLVEDWKSKNTNK